MEQRRLRPGDTIEDYCTRERRLTDHVVVAVVDDVVKQTRCTACDTEHPFKDARVPPRRKKTEAVGVLRKRLEESPPEDPVEEAPEPGPLPNLVVRPERKPARGKRGVAHAAAPPPALASSEEPPPVAAAPVSDEPEAEPAPVLEDDGPVHRRLIRATLPRPEGQVPARPIPEFTIRQSGARGAPRAPFAKAASHRPGTPWDRGNGTRPGSRTHGHGAHAQPRDKGRGRGPRHHKKSR